MTHVFTYFKGQVVDVPIELGCVESTRLGIVIDHFVVPGKYEHYLVLVGLEKIHLVKTHPNDLLHRWSFTSSWGTIKAKAKEQIDELQKG